MQIVLLILTALVISSCGNDSKQSALSKNRSFMANGSIPNFFVEKAKNKPDTENPTDCRKNIEEVVCLVDTLDPNSIPGEDERPCLAGGEQYAEPFQKLYDNYPKALQQMFCSLDRLYIEKVFFGTAYAGIITDEAGNITGARMGIRKSVIDEALSLTTWASWKEQLNFGGVKDSYTLTEGMPKHLTSTSAQVNDFLYFVVAHEFGHIFDFANDLNKIDPACQGEECPFAEGSWGNISWESNSKAKLENEFQYRKDLCFYWCESNPISIDKVPQLYRNLHRSNFISTYASTQAWDDFADSLAYVVMSYYLQSKYTIDTAQDAAYDVMHKLNSEKFKEKREFIHRFLSGPVEYP